MYLNVGSNERHLDGFVNIDIEPIADVCCDVRWGLPFADGAFEGVYSEHFIEHIPPADAVAFLRECRRITAVGGRIRIATPSSTWLDEEELCRIGAIAGLELVGRVEPGHSDDPAFRGVETRSGSRLVVEFLHRRPEVRDDQPVVSVLIAAYRADFLDEAIRSARDQTWPELEIIVGDDCPDSSVREVAERHAAEDPRVVYHCNPEPRGARRNYYRLFDESSGEYVKYLNDDDVLHPRCVERMARTLNALPRVTVVTSHRLRITAEGGALPDDGATRRRHLVDSIVPGPAAVTAMLGTGINWIGEPTTTMYRRSDVTDIEPELYAFGGRVAIENGDVTMWTRLLSRGDLCYLTESLSFFRQHDGQAQVADGFRQRALAAWEQIRFDGTRLGLVSPAHRHLGGRLLELRPWWSAATVGAVLRADALLEAGDAAGALSELDDAVTSSEHDSAVCELHASLATAMGEAERSIPVLETAISADPTAIGIRASLAVALAATGRHDDTIAVLRAADAQAPGSDLLRVALSRIEQFVPAAV